ncbi:APC family permease [[Acholeplasma] multilocale]|uniref:APC family permease n=1 Tax=[Acholeplasma] multilocale TaxID=264638 RepID=UPI000688A9C2|nr:APC family permease [[Acholeplasma] multilocale]
MKKGKTSSSKFFEFMTLFTMVLGILIGTGIYMKNNELLTGTQNPIIAIILWIVVGLVCVGTVYIFLEISSSTKDFGNGTVGNWSKLFINRRAASLFSMMYTVVYVPSCQSIFSAMFLTYFFQAAGLRLSAEEMFTIYLLVGITMIVTFTMINVYSQTVSRSIQVFGTAFKFIPLLIALVAGFVLAGTHDGAMWVDDQGWSTSSFDVGLFFRGFGGILFSFDGFIYIANAQKTAKHKQVVPKALLAGMVFVAVFYVLMAISLFLGSPDGSIVQLLERVFSGGSVGGAGADTARIITSVISMIICILGVNTFSFIGVVGHESDARAKLFYSRNRKASLFKSGMTQIACSVVIYTLFLTIGLLTMDKAGHELLSNLDYNRAVTNSMVKFIGIMSSTASCLGFGVVSSLIFVGILNRKTNKVKVDKVKGFVPIAWICGILMASFVILGIFTFLVPNNVLYGDIKVSWSKSDGLPFLILLSIELGVILTLFLIQEYMFKKDPFVEGFDGELEASENFKILPWIKSKTKAVFKKTKESELAK